MLRAGVALQEIAHTGRWLSDRSMREYSRKGEIAQLKVRRDIPPETRARVGRLASVGEHVWELKTLPG